MSYPMTSTIDAPVSVYTQRVADEYVGADEITPNDSLDVTTPPLRALLVGVAGDVKVTTWDGSVVTIPFAAKVPLKLLVKRVWKTGTTATQIVGLY